MSRLQFTALERTVDPTAEPVTLAELRKQLGLTATGSPESHLDDAYVTGLGKAARQYVERVTGHPLMTQTWRMTLADFPPSRDRAIYLAKPPVQSVASVTYIDSTGTEQTWSSSEYEVDTRGLAPRLKPLPGYSWPTTGDYLNAVTVTTVNGHAATSSPVTDAAENVPEEAKHAIKLLVTHWYDQRAPVNVGNITSQLAFSLDSLLGVLWVPRVF